MGDRQRGIDESKALDFSEEDAERQRCTEESLKPDPIHPAARRAAEKYSGRKGMEGSHLERCFHDAINQHLCDQGWEELREAAADFLPKSGKEMRLREALARLNRKGSDE